MMGRRLVESFQQNAEEASRALARALNYEMTERWVRKAKVNKKLTKAQFRARGGHWCYKPGPNPYLEEFMDVD